MSGNGEERRQKGRRDQDGTESARERERERAERGGGIESARERARKEQKRTSTRSCHAQAGLGHGHAS